LKLFLDLISACFNFHIPLIQGRKNNECLDRYRLACKAV
jgi:hypothetical protein